MGGCERNWAHCDGDGGGDKNQLVGSGQKLYFITINEIVFLKCLVLCAIFVKLAKYSFLHNNSINIYTIFLSLSIFPGLITNKYVKSSS